MQLCGCLLYAYYIKKNKLHEQSSWIYFKPHFEASLRKVKQYAFWGGSKYKHLCLSADQLKFNKQLPCGKVTFVMLGLKDSEHN